MYSSEDLERFYVEYQSEWVPRGLTMLAVQQVHEEVHVGSCEQGREDSDLLLR